MRVPSLGSRGFQVGGVRYRIVLRSKGIGREGRFLDRIFGISWLLGAFFLVYGCLVVYRFVFFGFAGLNICFGSGCLWVFCLSGSSDGIVWMGKPWIVPGVVIRVVAVLVALAFVVGLEFLFGMAYVDISGLPIVLWSVLAFLILLVASLWTLVLLRVANTYVLRNDSLEVRTGIFTVKSFVVSPSGFGSMEVVRTIVSRLFNIGNITVRTQDVHGIYVELLMVKDAEAVAGQIREVMSKPVVRLEK